MSRRGSTTPTTDIAVVGGGLAGLLAAARIARGGRSVVLVAPPRKPDRRTTALFGASIDALHEAGVWPTVAEISQPLRAIRLIDATARLLRAPDVTFTAGEIGLDAFGYNIPNEPLLAGLEAAVKRAGVRIVAAAAERFRREPDAVSIEAGGEELQARLVIAADGQASPCRRFAGIGLDLRGTGQTALVCNFSHAVPHDDVSTEFHTEAGPFTLVPLGPGRSALVWVAGPAEAELMGRLAPAALADAIEQRSFSLLGAVEVDGPAQLFPLRSGIADRLSADRIVLIGEAAHVLPPIGAQGFNLTVRDIETAADLVAGTGDPGAAAVTDRYQRRRSGDVSLRAAAVDVVNRSLLSSLLPAQLARAAGLFALAEVGPLRRAVIREGLSAAHF